MNDRVRAIRNTAHELGMFRLDELAALTGLTPGELGLALVADDIAEPVAERAGLWRSRNGATSSDTPLVAPTIERTMIESAERALRPVERGRVHDPESRALAIEAARERLRLGSLSAATNPNLTARIRAVQRRITRLDSRGQAGAEVMVEQLADWTEGLRPVSAVVPFELGQALRAAARRADEFAAVFAPAQSALAADIAVSPERMALAGAIDHRLRRAALGGDIFAVLSLACLCSAIGVGGLADAMVAALTSPGFAAADRVARRIAYAALASLARPGVDEPARAAHACDYLLRRESPGRDELELLAPAALQAIYEDSAAPVALIGRWLKWEADYDHQSLDHRHSFLPRLGHVARNLGCSLEQRDYRPLQRGISRMADDEDGVALILHLGSASNRALYLAPLGEGLSVEPRNPVARVIGGRQPPRLLSIEPNTRVAQLVEDLTIIERCTSPAFRISEFRQARSRKERRDAA